MRQFVDSTGKLAKSRRGDSKGSSYDRASLSDKDDLPMALARLQARVAELEANKPFDFIEFDVAIGATGSVSLAHGFSGPIRWYVTSWRQPGTVGACVLADKNSTTAGILTLTSNGAAGQAVIRIESVPWAQKLA